MGEPMNSGDLEGLEEVRSRIEQALGHVLGDAEAVGAVDAADQAVSTVGVELKSQNSFAPRVETRLTQEVRGLIRSLHEFALRTQAICEEPACGAEHCKPVALALSLCSLQVAVLLSQGLNENVFGDDAAQYVRQLGLSGKDLFRQLRLDGRDFLAISLGKQEAD